MDDSSLRPSPAGSPPAAALLGAQRLARTGSNPPFHTFPSTTCEWRQAVDNTVHLVEGGGFEPPKLSRQIYSLIPLATREPLRKAAHCPEGERPCQQLLTVNEAAQASRPVASRETRLWFPAHRLQLIPGT